MVECHAHLCWDPRNRGDQPQTLIFTDKDTDVQREKAVGSVRVNFSFFLWPSPSNQVLFPSAQGRVQSCEGQSDASRALSPWECSPYPGVPRAWRPPSPVGSPLSRTQGNLGEALPCRDRDAMCLFSRFQCQCRCSKCLNSGVDSVGDALQVPFVSLTLIVKLLN